MNWWTKFVDWVKNLFHDNTEYTVIIWYVYEEVQTDTGVKTVKRKQRGYSMREIIKKSNTHFVGKSMQGQTIEIKAVIPFDYEIHRVH
jgi:hypothetical protein